MMRMVIAAAMVALSGAAVAQERIESSDGDWFSVTCDDSGITLSPDRADMKPILLLRQCDALSADYGDGVWAWANGGTRVDFTGQMFGFPRQHPYCASAPDDFPVNCRF